MRITPPVGVLVLLGCRGMLLRLPGNFSFQSQVHSASQRSPPSPEPAEGVLPTFPARELVVSKEVLGFVEHAALRGDPIPVSRIAEALLTLRPHAEVVRHFAGTGEV